MIEFKNIYKSYFLGQQEVHAVNDISFSIAAAEFVSIMGASGSGKTTTMNILGLLDRPTAGEYFLNGQEVSQLSRNELARLRNRTIGFIFQQFFLLPRLDAVHNVMLPLLYRDESPNRMKKLAMESLAKVGMDKFYNHRPMQLSGGQQQRVAIARALVTDPHIILADEPTGALDSVTGQNVMNLLIELNKTEATTVIIVTHDLHIAEQCERVIRLKDGKIIKE